MKLTDYIRLSNEEQWNVLWTKGKFISFRTLNNHKYFLFAIERFFIEIKIDHGDEFVSKREFLDGPVLDIYLPSIDDTLMHLN